MTPEFGLGVQGDKSVDDYVATARRAEESGFDVISVYSDLMFQPPIVPLTVMAGVTERIRLGPACLNPFSLDGDVARDRARTEVAIYLAVVAELDPTIDLPPDLLPRLHSRLAVGDHAGAGRLIPDAVLDAFAIAGTPAEVSRHAALLIDAGASRVEFGTPHGLTWQRGLELLGTEVLSELRRMSRIA